MEDHERVVTLTESDLSSLVQTNSMELVHDIWLELTLVKMLERSFEAKALQQIKDQARIQRSISSKDQTHWRGKTHETRIGTLKDLQTKNEESFSLQTTVQEHLEQKKKVIHLKSGKTPNER